MTVAMASELFHDEIASIAITLLVAVVVVVVEVEAVLTVGTATLVRALEWMGFADGGGVLGGGGMV